MPGFDGDSCVQTVCHRLYMVAVGKHFTCLLVVV